MFISSCLNGNAFMLLFFTPPITAVLFLTCGKPLSERRFPVAFRFYLSLFLDLLFLIVITVPKKFYDKSILVYEGNSSVLLHSFG